MATRQEVNELLRLYQEESKASPAGRLSAEDALALAHGLMNSNTQDQIAAAIKSMEATPIKDHDAIPLLAAVRNRQNIIDKGLSPDSVEAIAAEAKLIEAQRAFNSALSPAQLFNIYNYGMAYKGIYYPPQSLAAEQVQKNAQADALAQNTALQFAWEFPNLEPKDLDDPKSLISQKMQAWLKGSDELGADGQPLAGNRAGKPPITNVGFAEVVKNYQSFAGLANFLRELKQKAIVADIATLSPGSIPAIIAFYKELGVDPKDTTKNLYELSRSNPKYLSALEHVPGAEARKLIQELVRAESDAKLVAPETDSKIAQAENVTGDTIVQAIESIGDTKLTPENVGEYQAKIVKELQKKNPNVKWETVVKGIQSYLQLKQTVYGLVPAEQEAAAKRLDALIKSVNLGEIEQFADVYKEFMTDGHGKTIRSFLDVARDTKLREGFLKATQGLPQPLYAAIKTIMEDQGKITIMGPQIDAQLAQFQAQALKYQPEILKRLIAKGIKTSEDRIKAGEDGTLQAIIDSQKDESGKDIPMEVRKAIREDFASQFNLTSSAVKAEVDLKTKDAQIAERTWSGMLANLKIEAMQGGDGNAGKKFWDMSSKLYGNALGLAQNGIYPSAPDATPFVLPSYLREAKGADIAKLAREGARPPARSGELNGTPPESPVHVELRGSRLVPTPKSGAEPGN